MNNKNIMYIILTMIFIIILSLLYVFNLPSIDENVLNKKWYRYNYLNGYYDVIEISENRFSYYKPTNENSTNEYDSCKYYKYNKKNKTLTLDCNKKVVLNKVLKNSVVFNIDNKNYKYFDNIEDSLNYEFKNYFKLSLSEYKNNNKHVTDIIKIKPDKILDLYKEKEYSKIIFMSDKCTNIDCVLIYELIEKWISYSNSIYFVDSNELTINFLKKLVKENNSFSDDLDFYNSSYPKVIVVNNKKIVDTYDIMCRGFNCSMYYNK